MSILEDQTAEVARAESEVVAPPAVAGFSPGAASSLASELGRLLRTVFSFPVVLLSVLSLFVAGFMAQGGVNDPDIWWHLRNAEYLLSNMRFMRADLYSSTLAGHAWVNPEWLAEIPFYLAWRTGGLLGIKVLTFLLAEAIILGLFYRCYKSAGNVKAVALACYFAVFLAVVNFGPRTILFGYLCLLIMLIILDRFRAQGKAPLWVLPPLFCLWANTHGTWLIGLVIFGIIVASSFIEGRWGRVEAVRWSPRQLRNLLLAMGGSIAALFVNPYGKNLLLWSVLYPFRLKLNVSHVEEWASVDFHTPRGKLVLILLAGLLLAALLSSYRWKLTEVALVLFAIYSSLSYQRFLFLAAILLAPVVANLLGFLPRYRPEIDKPVLNAVILAGVLAMMASWLPSSAELNKTLAEVYPVDAVPYLRSHQISGPVFNDYLWGGYLEWNDRSVKTFIDSRVDIFEYAGVLKDYLNATAIQGSLEVLDQYKVRYILFSSGQPLVYLLRNSPNWKVVYEDKVSVLFERTSTTSASVGSGATVGGLPQAAEASALIN